MPKGKENEGMDIFQICVVEGPQAGILLHSKGTTMRIGRTKASQLQVKDPSVSEKHGEVTWMENSWHIRDLGSSNGTMLNGKPVKDKYVALKDGDVLKLGTESIAHVKIIKHSSDDVTVQQFLEVECTLLGDRIRGHAEQLAAQLQEEWAEEKNKLLAMQ